VTTIHNDNTNNCNSNNFGVFCERPSYFQFILFYSSLGNSMSMANQLQQFGPIQPQQQQCMWLPSAHHSHYFTISSICLIRMMTRLHRTFWRDKYHDITKLFSIFFYHKTFLQTFDPLFTLSISYFLLLFNLSNVKQVKHNSLDSPKPLEVSKYRVIVTKGKMVDMQNGWERKKLPHLSQN